MILYESSLGGFITNCDSNNIDQKLLDQYRIHGIEGTSPSEQKSWSNSLPFIADTLRDDSISKELNVAIEYKLETTKNRIDFLIYGKNNEDCNSMVIVELKQWSGAVKQSLKSNYVHTNGGNGDDDYFHPSYQSYRYKKILEGFNEYIQEDNTAIESCSYLHNMDNVYEFILRDNSKYPFIDQSPVFLKSDQEKLRDFIKKYVTKSSRKLLYEIDSSRIRPSKDFSNMLYSALKGNQIFSLDDNQAAAVATVVEQTELALKHNQRTTIIIKGGPGTGKSIVAINSMGQLIHPKKGDPYNVCYCTANFTPRTLFNDLLKKDDYTKAAIDNLFKSLAPFSKASEFDYDCIMIDEAHRAFQWKFGQGVLRTVDMIGKIFSASRVQVFFIDEDQIVTKDDYLTIDKIKKYAEKYRSFLINTETLKLSSQFRCMGGERYIHFLNHLLGYEGTPVSFYSQNYDLRVFDSPSEMYDEIQKKQYQDGEVDKYTRLLAGYTHEFKTRIDPNDIDFDMDNHKFMMRWNKDKCKIAYINDETQLDRIGSIHTIQGVDMNYAGVIIGKDVLYRDGKIIFNKDANAKSDTASGIRTAKDEDAIRMIRNTYKVLLTRAIFGTYIYCEDEELNIFLKGLIK